MRDRAVTRQVVLTEPAPQNTRTDPLRVAICGEVSSGKSTVMNTLLRRSHLPDNLGQKRRPMIVAGYRDRTGIEILRENGDIVELDQVTDFKRLRDASQITLWSDQPHLAGYEFTEVPMTTAEDVSDAQIALLRSADVLIWVTIASQAWRLTEKAILEKLGDARPKRSILAVSRADKLRSKNDMDRIGERLERDAGAFFEDVVFVSGGRAEIDRSTQSQEAWIRTGGAEFRAHSHLGPVGAAEPEKPDPTKALPAAAEATVAKTTVAVPTLTDAEMVTEDEIKTLDSDTSVGLLASKGTRAQLRKDLGALAAMVSGTKVFGLMRDAKGRQLEIFVGEPRYGRSVARACAALIESLTANYSFVPDSGEVHAAILTGRDNYLFCQNIAGTGLAFMMSDRKDATLGSSQNALSRLCRLIEDFETRSQARLPAQFVSVPTCGCQPLGG